MKPKQTLLFLLLNIIGYSTLAISCYFYFLKNVFVASILLVISILIILISFKVGLKVEKINEDYSSKENTTEENELDIVPITQIDSNEAISSQDNSEEINELQQAVFEDSNVAEILSHYSSYEISRKPGIITASVDTVEMLEINLISLSDKMDTYGLIKKNPLFNYRFEAILKQGLSNTKIWENLYEFIPYVDIVEQYIDTMNRSVYLVRASINERSRSNIGYLPFNVKLNLNEIQSIEGTIIGGKYNYLNSDNSSFATFEEPLKLHIKIHSK